MSIRPLLLCVVLPVLVHSANRTITVQGGKFVDAAGNIVKLVGSNVVVKGPPWLPEVSGNSPCHGEGNCRTFNEADAKHFQSQGWNFMRLGTIWAGAQQTSEAKLDSDFVRRLLAILDLCHAHGIHVLLDIHQDAVSSQSCGVGLPAWFFKESQPLGVVGWPLIPQIKWPYKGYCGPSDFSNWGKYSGEEQYNVKNPCCKLYNGYNTNSAGWARLLPTVQAQAALYYLFNRGRAEFAVFVGLLAAAVKDHPAAFGIELMNEPPSIERTSMYDTWMAAYTAIRAEVPDMSVGIMDVGEIPVSIGTLGLSDAAKGWLKSPGIFYCYHYYSPPSLSVDEALAMAVAQSVALGGMPALLTETQTCDAVKKGASLGAGAAHWHYSNYCDSGFGACITGWGGGSPNGCGHSDALGGDSNRLNVSIVV